MKRILVVGVAILATSAPLSAQFDTTVKVMLVSVDVSTFAWGDYFVYQVLIENTGKKPVTLPWSPDRGAFGQAEWRIPPGFRRGRLNLEALAADGGSDVLGVLEGETLYGSPAVPGSLLVLAPGRTALIRAPAQWTRTIPDGSMKTILQQPDGAVRIRAKYSSSTNEIATTHSTNTIPVRVMPRPPD